MFYFTRFFYRLRSFIGEDTLSKCWHIYFTRSNFLSFLMPFPKIALLTMSSPLTTHLISLQVKRHGKSLSQFPKLHTHLINGKGSKDQLTCTLIPSELPPDFSLRSHVFGSQLHNVNTVLSFIRYFIPKCFFKE